MNRVDRVKQHMAEYAKHLAEGQVCRADSVLRQHAHSDIKYLLSRVEGMDKKAESENDELILQLKTDKKQLERALSAAYGAYMEQAEFIKRQVHK